MSQFVVSSVDPGTASTGIFAKSHAFAVGTVDAV